RKQPGKMQDTPGFLEGDLAAVVDRIVELAEVLCVARVRPIEELDLEAEVNSGGFRIERALEGQRYLVEQRLAGLVGDQMPKVQPIRRIVRVDRYAAFDHSRCHDRAPPVRRRRRGGGLGSEGIAAGKA